MLISVVDLLVPCILHLEDQVGEKILTTIVCKGQEFCGGGVAAYIAAMQSIT